MTSLPAYLSADPWTASKIDTSVPTLADGAKPSPPTNADDRSLRMSPFILVVTMTSYCSGFLTS